MENENQTPESTDTESTRSDTLVENIDPAPVMQSSSSLATEQLEYATDSSVSKNSQFFMSEGDSTHPETEQFGSVISSLEPPQNKPRLTSRKLFVYVLVPIILLIIGVTAIGAVSYKDKAAIVASDMPQNNAGKFDSSSVFTLLPPLQGKAITADITLNITGRETKQLHGTVVTNEKGETGVKLISNIDKVNTFVEYLAKKTTDSDTPELDSVDEFFSYDYSELAGYDGFLYDPTRMLFGNHIAHAKAAQESSSNSEDFMYKKSSECERAIKVLETAVGPGLTNKTLEPSFTEQNGYIVVGYDQSVIDNANEKLMTFFSTCMDTTKPSMVDYDSMVQKLNEQKPSLPSFKYKELKDNAWELEIMTNSLAKMTFTISNIKDRTDEVIEAGPYSRLVNQYGLTYDWCRLPPTMASAMGDTYDFYAEDEGYTYPSEFNSGYYCAPSEAYGYQPPSSIYFEDPQVSFSTTDYKTIKYLTIIPEIRSYAERQFMNTGKYPPLSEIVANHTGFKDNRAEIESVIDSGSIKYELLPENCSENCTDYVTSTKITEKITLTSYSYNH